MPHDDLPLTVDGLAAWCAAEQAAGRGAYGVLHLDSHGEWLVLTGNDVISETPQEAAWRERADQAWGVGRHHRTTA